MEYLLDNIQNFWRSYHELWSSDIPKTSEQKSSQTFRIITPFYNVENFLPITIYSLKNQLNKNFKSYLVDDCSDDHSVAIASYMTDNDSRFLLTKNTEKKYALANIVNAINSIEDIADDDIIILLDGDDWLASENVLSHLEKIYTDEDCLMTYGSYAYFPTGQKGVEPSVYPQEVIANNMFRQDRWRASHLRTYKYKLWKNIKDEDLRGDQGYYNVAYDQAIMFPLLEMASNRSKYISETLHVYNRTNPLNVDKIKERDQQLASFDIRNKQPYEKCT